MMGPTLTLTKKLTGLKDFKEAMVAVRNAEVLVGIPQATSSRRGGHINNAELLFIFTNGSPARHQPPRPVIEPAIMAPGNKEPIARELEEAAAAWLHHEPKKALQFLKRAGTAARDASKAWFTDPRNNWAPNAPSTIRAKLAHLGPKRSREAHALIAAQGGDTTGVVVPGIDTGAMRKAITYVVRQGGAVTEAEQLRLENEKK